MSLEVFFSATTVSVAIAFLLAAGALAASMLALTTLNLPARVALHVSIWLVHASLAFFVGGFCAMGIQGVDPARSAIFAEAIFFSIHAHWLTRRALTHSTTENTFGSSTLSAPPPDSHIGVDHVYATPDAAFAESLRAALVRAREVIFICPNANTLLFGANPLADALRGALAQVRSKIVHSGGVEQSLLQQYAIQAELIRSHLDEGDQFLFAILADNTYFAGFRTGRTWVDSAIATGSIHSPPQGLGGSIAYYVHALTNRIQPTAELRASVTVCSTPFAYHSAICEAERVGTEIARIPKRISVVFKGDDLISFIGSRRFGAGSPSLPPYIAAHRQRREQFIVALSRGLICREIYNRDALISYIKSPRHAGTGEIPDYMLLDCLHRWIAAIRDKPSYIVGLTDEQVPLKYQIVDGRLVFVHEAIGTPNLHRLNAYILDNSDVAAAFASDFEQIWDRISSSERQPDRVVSWIESKLLRPVEQRHARGKDVRQ